MSYHVPLTVSCSTNQRAIALFALFHAQEKTCSTIWHLLHSSRWSLTIDCDIVKRLLQKTPPHLYKSHALHQLVEECRMSLYNHYHHNHTGRTLPICCFWLCYLCNSAHACNLTLQTTTNFYYGNDGHANPPCMFLPVVIDLHMTYSAWNYYLSCVYS